MELDFGPTQFLQIVCVALFAQVIIQPFGAVLASEIDAKKAILIMLLPEVVLLQLSSPSSGPEASPRR